METRLASATITQTGMIKKIVLSFVGVVVLAAAAGAAYFYYYPPLPQVAPSAAVPAAPQAVPDNQILAGPVTAISAQSIGVKKQDGTIATLRIASTTQVVLAGQGSQAGTPKKVSDIKLGAMVLVTSNGSDATAQSIVLLPAPPASAPQ